MSFPTKPIEHPLTFHRNNVWKIRKLSKSELSHQLAKYPKRFVSYSVDREGNESGHFLTDDPGHADSINRAVPKTREIPKLIYPNNCVLEIDGFLFGIREPYKATIIMRNGDSFKV